VNKMNATNSDTSQQLARMAGEHQQKRTGLAPTAVTVILSEDTLVVTLRGALTPAEKGLARTPQGAAQVQEFHRQLFTTSADSMRQEIKNITGRKVCEAAAEIETAASAVAHAFTTGAMVQVFLLTPDVDSAADRDSIDCANDDGLRPVPDVRFQDDPSL
jgi:uncharacterized protein YbcI